MNTISELRAEYCPMKNVIEETREELRDLTRGYSENQFSFDEREDIIDSALTSLHSSLKGNDAASEKMIFDYFTNSIEYYTTELALAFPEYFAPYYFK